MAEAAVAPVVDTPEAEVALAVAAEVAEAADAKQKRLSHTGQPFLGLSAFSIQYSAFF